MDPFKIYFLMTNVDIPASFYSLPDGTTQDVPAYMDDSENRGTSKSSILIGFSVINHPFWDTPIFGNTYIYHELDQRSSRGLIGGRCHLCRRTSLQRRFKRCIDGTWTSVEK